MRKTGKNYFYTQNKSKRKLISTKINLVKVWKCSKVYEGYIEFGTKETGNTKRAERQKASFAKELVGNADLLYKPVLNKIMTTHE